MALLIICKQYFCLQPSPALPLAAQDGTS